MLRGIIIFHERLLCITLDMIKEIYEGGPGLGFMYLGNIAGKEG
jgi:hypothetical protein